MTNTLYIVYLLIGCCFAFIMSILVLILRKRKLQQLKLASVMNQDTITIERLSRKQLLQKKIGESSYFNKYIDYIKKLINLTFSPKTIEDILYYQKIVFTIGSICVFTFLFIASPIFLIFLIFCWLLLLTLPVISLQSELKKKNDYFNSYLSTFLTHVLLVLDSGYSLENSFAFGVKNIPNQIVKREFEKLLVEMRVHTDNISLAFINLHKRVATTDCEKFCNLIINGLSNGHAMSTILKNERARLFEKQKTEIEKTAKSNENIATASTVILVFIPTLLLFLLPLMSTNI